MQRQKTIYEFLVFVMKSSYFTDDVIEKVEGQPENQCNFHNFRQEKLVDASGES